MDILNRKATFNYFIDETYEAGIALTGTEIKSIRKGNCNIKDAYGIIRKNEIYLINMYVGQYEQGNIFNHEETRSRKLLLHKSEIKKIAQAIELQGATLVPLKLYFKNNKLKVSLAIAHGKKNVDKRNTIKERDIQRDIQKNIKRY